MVDAVTGVGFYPQVSVHFLNAFNIAVGQRRTILRVTLEMLKDIQDSAENYKQNTKYWKWPNNNKYNDNIIPDPHKYLLGFVHRESENIISDDNNRKINGERKLSKYEKEAIEILEED